MPTEPFTVTGDKPPVKLRPPLEESEVPVSVVPVIVPPLVILLLPMLMLPDIVPPERARYVELRLGISDATKARNVGAEAPPDVGPAKTVFAVSVANVPVSVPELVTGEFVTVKIEGSERPTLVTVPVVGVVHVGVAPAPALVNT